MTLIQYVKSLTVKDTRKALVALATFLLTLVSLGVFSAEVQPYVHATLAALGAVGVFAVRNGSKPVDPDA